MKSKIQLSQICKIILSGTPKTSISEYWHGNIKWVTPTDITNINHRYIQNTERTISEKGIQNSPAKLLDRDTIIISARGTVGELCILPFEMSCNQSCYALKPDLKLVKPLYLFYVLKNLKNHYSQIAHGTTFDTITKSTFDEIKINLHSLKEQEKIVNYLDHLDSQIENLQKQNKILEQIAHTIFKSWFVDFDGVIEFKNSELGKIPKKWIIKLFDEVAEIRSGKRPRKISKIQTGEYNIPCHGASKIDAYVQEALVEKPILLTGRVGTLGIIHRVYVPCFPSDNTITILMHNNSFYEYVYFCLKKIDFQSYNRGTSQPLLTQTDVKNFKILIPHSRILKSFNTITRQLFKKIDENNLQISNLAKIRDSLLPKLMSGEIRV